MTNLFARVFYGVPEAFYKVLRPYKAPLLLLVGTVLGTATFWFACLVAALKLTHDPRWLVVIITGSHNGLSIFLKLNGQTVLPVQLPDALHSASTRLTPFQTHLVVGLQWWVQIEVWLCVIALFWLMGRLTNPFKRKKTTEHR